MSARKAEIAGSTQNVTVQARQVRLALLPGAVWVRKDGIEFRSATPFPLWTEMTVVLETPRNGGKINCSGVVVGCSGNRHMGYVITMVFTGLSKQSLARLSSFVSTSA